MSSMWKKSKPSFDPNKPFAWAFSRLKNMESCPKRHFHVDILRDVKEGDSTALLHGNAVHDALARAVGNVGGRFPDASDTVPLPEPMAELQPFVDERRAMRAKGADVQTELSLAMDAKFQPVEWFGKGAWYRAKIDVLTLFKNVAGAFDWKTGKVTDDSPQLRMTALLVFANYPQVQRIVTRFIWLRESSETREVVDRADQARIWADIAPRVERLRAAYANPDPSVGFPPKPGFLCKSWCPVKSCKYNGT